MATEVSKDESPASQASRFVSRVFARRQREASSATGGLQMSGRGSIRRVPKDLRERNEEQFTPRIVSIGPIHASDARLRPYQDVKEIICCEYVIHMGSRAEDCYKELAEKETEARECYDHDEMKHWASDDFLEMMFTDGCFILELLTKECVYYRDLNIEVARRDVFLLENQIPFLVLSILFKHSKVLMLQPLEISADRSLVSDLKKFLFDDLYITRVLIDDDQLKRGSFCHLLDFAWQLNCPRGISSNQVPSVRAEDLRYAKSISELALYGIKFERIRFDEIKTFFKFKRESCWFERKELQREPPPPLGMEYTDGALKLRPMFLDYLSTTLYWNLLAYEQQPDFKKVRFFQSFIVFMSTLIQTENDFKLLERKKLIYSDRIYSSTPMIAMLFRDLSKNIRNVPDTGYMKIINDMNDDCKRWIPSLWANLMCNYYDARWDVLQSILLFILTVTQTIYTVLSYKGKGT